MIIHGSQTNYLNSFMTETWLGPQRGNRYRDIDIERDWVAFIILRNKCTALIRRSKSEYYLNETSQNLNNPIGFWKTIKSLSPSTLSNDFPDQILVNDSLITNRTDMVNSFNKHFISSGSIFNEISVSDIPNPSPLR